MEHASGVLEVALLTAAVTSAKSVNVLRAVRDRGEDSDVCKLHI